MAGEEDRSVGSDGLQLGEGKDQTQGDTLEKTQQHSRSPY